MTAGTMTAGTMTAGTMTAETMTAGIMTSRAMTSGVLDNADLLGLILKMTGIDMTMIDTLRPDNVRQSLRLLSPLACQLIDEAVSSYVDFRFSACEKLIDFDANGVARDAGDAIKRLPGLLSLRLEVCSPRTVR